MARKIFFVCALLLPLCLWALSGVWPGALWAFVGVGPLIGLGVHDVLQKRHSLLRVYPVVGHGRYLMEAFRPEMQQYFVESNIDGKPFSREQRSVIYQRAKGDLDTMPFGTQREVYAGGYEWMNHSILPKPYLHDDPRVLVGGPACTKPYRASHLNISAMSFGSLSPNAILALNMAAKQGGFAHNTGEGGISPYHLQPGGDLIWQVGTGYFGCRTPEGGFDPERFAENAQREVVKMIELKLSQGAKPGHGGILPAAKLTREIAQIRGVRMGHDVLSPPAHSAFGSPIGLLEFIAKLRELSGGKPVGFKLCVGKPADFLAICKAMVKTGIIPDFITVDGAEGGTGAAPVELSNSVGTPLRQGLTFVDNALRGVGLRDKIRVIAAGKVVTGFHMFRLMALGADMCNAARPMLFALGCIQARRCNDNTCPVGVATQDPSRAVGLVPEAKAPRVARYHKATIKAYLELLGCAGLESPRQVRRDMILRQVDGFVARTLAELYPQIEEGCLLSDATVPASFINDWQRASAERF
ncbi:MAG: FMN-binding glutamate synthase family protein [Deltaproteobacteria bacterium]|nr:FMN-binding glutamate synthase family protein [Deltaproteobacteria bacterium]